MTPPSLTLRWDKYAMDIALEGDFNYYIALNSKESEYRVLTQLLIMLFLRYFRNFKKNVVSNAKFISLK